MALRGVTEAGLPLSEALPSRWVPPQCGAGWSARRRRRAPHGAGVRGWSGHPQPVQGRRAPPTSVTTGAFCFLQGAPPLCCETPGRVSHPRPQACRCPRHRWAGGRALQRGHGLDPSASEKGCRPVGHGDTGPRPHLLAGFTLIVRQRAVSQQSRGHGHAAVATCAAMPGGSSLASTLSLPALRMGSTAPGVLTTTFRISSSETLRPSLWRTFLQRQWVQPETGGPAGTPTSCGAAGLGCLPAPAPTEAWGHLIPSCHPGLWGHSALCLQAGQVPGSPPPV